MGHVKTSASKLSTVKITILKVTNVKIVITVTEISETFIKYKNFVCKKYKK